MLHLLHFVYLSKNGYYNFVKITNLQGLILKDLFIYLNGPVQVETAIQKVPYWHSGEVVESFFMVLEGCKGEMRFSGRIIKIEDIPVPVLWPQLHFRIKNNYPVTV